MQKKQHTIIMGSAGHEIAQILEQHEQK